MNRSLKVRLIVIVAVVGLCVYGIIGAPTSRQELTNNIKKHIRLGLDLSGGSQLVAQVHVQDAFKADADTLINRLKDQLQTAEIPYTTISQMTRNPSRTPLPLRWMSGESPLIEPRISERLFAIRLVLGGSWHRSIRRITGLPCNRRTRPSSNKTR